MRSTQVCGFLFLNAFLSLLRRFLISDGRLLRSIKNNGCRQKNIKPNKL